MAFKVTCRCGSTQKTFKKDLGLSFFIAECCEKAGYDHNGNKAGEASEDPKKEEATEVKKDEEYDALIAECLELHPHIERFDPNNMPTKEDLKIAIDAAKEEAKRKAEKQKRLNNPNNLERSAEQAYAVQMADLKNRYVKAERSFKKARNKDKRAKFKAEMDNLEVRIAELEEIMAK